MQLGVPGVHAVEFDVDAASIDVNGHVNNLVYLRWMQDVATAHSAACGWPLERYLATRTGWVVRSHAIDYLRPAFDGERIAALTWIRAFGQQASPRRYLFWRPRDRAVIAKAETVWVFMDGARARPARIPAAFRSAFVLVPDDAPVLAALGVGDAAAEGRARAM